MRNRNLDLHRLTTFVLGVALNNAKNRDGWGLDEKRPFGNSDNSDDVRAAIGLSDDSDEAREYAHELFAAFPEYLLKRWLELPSPRD